MTKEKTKDAKMSEPEFIEMMQDGAKENFMSQLSLMPVIAFHTKGKLGFVGVQEMQSKSQKEQIGNYLEELRTNCDMVIFASEAWTIKIDEDVDSDLDPSDHPDKREVLSLAFYEKNRTRIWFSDIVRADDDYPDSGAVLGPWVEMTENDPEIEGRFFEDLPALNE